MASSRANKYASLNFNDVYDKKTTDPTNKQHPSSSSSAQSSLSTPNKTILSNSRIHGNMLVLTRPSPKPLSQPPPPPPQPQPPPTRSESDPISLRPLGRTGSGPSLVPSPLTLPNPEKELFPLPPSPSPSPKANRFVPPHLRPGFVGREEKPDPAQGVRSRNFGSYGEDGRPKSGGGYERMRRVGDSDLVEVTRPGSGGSRPSSSG